LLFLHWDVADTWEADTYSAGPRVSWVIWWWSRHGDVRPQCDHGSERDSKIRPSLLLCHVFSPARCKPATAAVRRAKLYLLYHENYITKTPEIRFSWGITASTGYLVSLFRGLSSVPTASAYCKDAERDIYASKTTYTANNVAICPSLARTLVWPLRFPCDGAW